MSKKRTPETLPESTSSAEASPARTSASPDAGLAFTAPEAGCSSSLPESWARYVQRGFSWRMFPGFYPRTGETISASSSTPFRGSGMAWRGEYLTADTSESPSGAVGSTLSDILETSVPRRFYLSPRAAAGILRRAERRGRELPTALREALEALATGTGTPGTRPMSAASREQRRGEGGTETTPKEPQGAISSVRRLTPKECERLQTFPDGWTCLC